MKCSGVSAMTFWLIGIGGESLTIVWRKRPTDMSMYSSRMLVEQGNITVDCTFEVLKQIFTSHKVLLRQIALVLAEQ
jgi:hypothetical protein